MEAPTFPTDVLIHLSLASFPGLTQLSVTYSTEATSG